jgi:hypothetical protein
VYGAPVEDSMPVKLQDAALAEIKADMRRIYAE